MKKTKALAPTINPQRAPRERRIDHYTVSRLKRVEPGTIGRGQAEPVEQFEVRGGRVQRLTAKWNQSHANWHFRGVRAGRAGTLGQGICIAPRLRLSGSSVQEPPGFADRLQGRHTGKGTGLQTTRIRLPPPDDRGYRHMHQPRSFGDGLRTARLLLRTRSKEGGAFRDCDLTDVQLWSASRFQPPVFVPSRTRISTCFRPIGRWRSSSLESPAH